jgi:hypothetical protein
MGSVGLVVLLCCFAFFLVVGLGATSTLIGQAENSNDSSISSAAHGVGSTMTPLWTVFVWGVVIIGIYAVIHSYSTM